LKHLKTSNLELGLGAAFTAPFPSLKEDLCRNRHVGGEKNIQREQENRRVRADLNEDKKTQKGYVNTATIGMLPIQKKHVRELEYGIKRIQKKYVNGSSERNPRRLSGLANAF